MNRKTRSKAWSLLTAGTLALLGLQSSARAFTLNVVDKLGNPVTNGFRFMVEEDTTEWTTPGLVTNVSISTVIHKSYAPVVANGTNAPAVGDNSVDVSVPGTLRYVVSVLPMADHAMGAAQVAPGQTNVTVVVNVHKIPTAQIHVFVHVDHDPINNVADATEPGLPGFKLLVDDTLGPISQDVFGNPLGTVYLTDVNGEIILDVDGSPVVDIPGTGNIYTDANGHALVKYIAPGKYGVRVVPPTGSNWRQTSTIEGTPTIDAWVKADEAQQFMEGFGAGFAHCSFGFVDERLLPWSVTPPGGSATIRGRLVYNHFSRPPINQTFTVGPPVKEGWVGLNDLLAVQKGLTAVPCNIDTGEFVISNVPPGNYQLVSWDKPLISLFGFNNVTVTNGAGVVDLGNVFIFRWFGTFQGSVFYDEDQDGFRDTNEVGISQQNVNLRFRDGSIYQAQPTDPAGEYQFAEVFPFFKWLVAEVDYARFKPTGATIAVDEGGTIPAPDPNGEWIIPSFGILNPQLQYDFTGSTNPLAVDYNPNFGQLVTNVNTGNAYSRTEVGPVLTEAMHLFLNQANVIDWGKISYAPGENGGISGIVFYSTTRAEQDPRYAVGDPWEPGIPRVQVNLYRDANGDKIIDDLDGSGGPTLADVDNYPFGWRDGGAKGAEDLDRNGNNTFDPGDAIQIVTTDSWDDSMPTGSVQTNLPLVGGLPIQRGADNYMTWNQIRPGVFDGGYLFDSYVPTGLASGQPEVAGLPVGKYVVEAVPPPGYEIQKEEDLNVVFGDAFRPSALVLPPECVGDPHLVPAELTLFPGEPAPFAGTTRPLADRKWVLMSQGRNSGCDFHMFTYVPKAARAVGFVNNDLTAEFNAGSPIWGEKAAPAWIPVSFQDFAGNEVAHIYSDQFGSYNALLPSTYTANIPTPMGVSPNMLTLFLNYPTMADPNNPGQRIADPYYDPTYTTTPWTFHYYPGRASYLDTPLVPVGAFANNPDNRLLDVDPPSGTPVIHSVTGPYGGPYVATTNDQLVIQSAGTNAPVLNPNYTGQAGQDRFVLRDYGFGATTGTVTLSGTALKIVSWTPTTVVVTVPLGTPSGQLVLNRGTNATWVGVTVTVNGGGTVRQVLPSALPGAHPIQDAIDAADVGDLILVSPGVYNENVVLWKPVRLQGSGARSTILNAASMPTDRIAWWHNKVQTVLQTPGADPFQANELPGVLVLGDVPGVPAHSQGNRARIDGFHISGSVMGGGISVYTSAHYLLISNNRIQGNQGAWGGGIVIGTPNAGSGFNDNIEIRDNLIVKNGGISGAGGIALYTGSDNYVISHNIISGNLTRGSGAGIGHLGLSVNGFIGYNEITFNEVFYGLLAPGAGDGGGIFIGGEAIPAALSLGAGSVTINANLIQGNLSGAGYGGGIRASAVNGQDVADNPQDPGNWYVLDIFNNIIVNNVAGLAGGGVSLQDVASSRIYHNTIAHNDSSASGALSFAAGATDSTPTAGGFVSHAHSPGLLAALNNAQTFSNPTLRYNIIWHNRSFHVNGALNGGMGGLEENPDGVYWDLDVMGGSPGALLNPRNCLLTDRTGYDSSNITGDARFLNGYTNDLRMARVIDEAGNSISVRFVPIVPTGNYHLNSGSVAIDRAAFINITYLGRDFDRQNRPNSRDLGADERSTAAAQPLTIPPPGSGAPGIPVPPPPPIQVDPTPGGSGIVLRQFVPDTDPTDSDGDGEDFNDNVMVHLTGGDGFAKMADGTHLYTFGFHNVTAVPTNEVMANGLLAAELPAPTLTFREGQKVYLNLTPVGMVMRPDLFDPHTVHWHGFPNAASIFDGEPMAAISVNMGATLTYFYNVVEPGTYLYHCHVEATEHMQMGMIGNLWVYPKQNFTNSGSILPFAPGGKHEDGYHYVYNDGDGSTYYDVEFPLQIIGFDRNFHEQHLAVQPLPFAEIKDTYVMFNGRGYPDTVNTGQILNREGYPSQKVHSKITVQRGKKLLLRLSNVSTDAFHSIGTPGLTMKVVGKGAALLRGPTGLNLYYDTSSVTLGGGETADVIIDTRMAPAGTYPVYSTRLNFLSNDHEDQGGLMTELVITP